MTLVARTFRFGVVGVLTAVIHYSLLYIGVELLRLNPTLASSIGYPMAVIFNYLMHYSWTFAEPVPHGRTLGRYLVMIGCGFILNGSVMYWGEQWLAWHYLITQAVALVAVVVWNFTLMNVWVFRR
jgi:putative flippase GtrA